MRNRKGWSILIPFILIGIMALTGCSEEEASGGVTDVTDALFLSENVDEVDSSGEGADQESVSGIQGAEAEAGARIMTAEECSELSGSWLPSRWPRFLISCTGMKFCPAWRRAETGLTLRKRPPGLRRAKRKTEADHNS